MRFSWQGPSLVVHTPAKLNLFLEVRGRRPDGYHELETVMVSVDLFDTVRFAPGEHLALTVRRGPAALPEDDRNLVLRAARLLARHCDVRTGASMELIKRIPVESGMGGGSSDAAATLVALNRLWGTGLSSGELHHLAAQLGSDVNFFLDSVSAAVCRGRGEQVEPIDLPRTLHFVVVRPRGGLSTKEVFQRLDSGDVPSNRSSSAALQEALGQGGLGRIAEQLHNRLETPARELSRDVAESLRQLKSTAAAGAAMTGSGTGCFALCRSARQARSLGRRLRSLGKHHVWSVSGCS